MSTRSKNSNRRNRRRGGPRRPDSYQRPERPMPPCAVCGEIIRDITSALGQSADGQPVHFDCALKAAQKELEPQGDEKVIYLGKGRFAAVDAGMYQKRRLKILRQTDWEVPQEPLEWRTNLRLNMK
ncbi:MAG: hypothetical protein MI717_00180 [Spirochaetales bacterium]|nr:hypothetical protein [Spirochaetales bacterium]